jgi:DNA polymerase III epsilon subunit-like protein
VKAFIFDTETTGLVKNSLIPLPSQPRIIEFFGHTVDDETGQVIEELEFLCNPGGAFDLEVVRPGDRKSITQMTGIRNIDVKDAQPFSFYVSKIIDMLSEADVAVAHNLSFDKQLLDCEIVRSEICLKNGIVPWPRLICTVEQTEWIKGHRLSLTDLHQYLFDEPFKGAHRARHDVEALTRCYLELRKRGDL